PEPAPEPTPVQPALPPRPERRRLTEAEVRAKIQYRINRDGRDKIAASITKDKLIREYADELVREFPNMDDDERQQRINEFAQQLIDAEDNNDATKIQ